MEDNSLNDSFAAASEVLLMRIKAYNKKLQKIHDETDVDIVKLTLAMGIAITDQSAEILRNQQKMIMALEKRLEALEANNTVVKLDKPPKGP